MDIQAVVANVQRRKAEQAVSNELALHALHLKNAAFEELRTNLLAELATQVEHLAQNGIIVHANEDDKTKTVVNRDDSGKTLTISFSPIFHRVSFNYDGGAVFKRTLTVEAHTLSGLLGSRELFTYRRENNTVVKPSEIASFVAGLLDTLLK